MAKKPPQKQPGAEKKLCHLTYSQIAKWVKLAPRSVIQYASRGEFDSGNIESILRWVNTRRLKQGLPLIGIPPERAENPTTENKPKSDQQPVETEKHEAAENVTVRPSVQLGGYNPETGEYEA